MPERLDFLGRSLALATGSQAMAAGLSLYRMLRGPAARRLWPAAAVLSIPAVIALVSNLEIVLRDEVVPGANDNLSGAAAVVELARRLAPTKPDDVEIVFGITGCEEAGTGGAVALANRQKDHWEPFRTVIIALDSLSNGELRYFVEGEIFKVPTPPWLEKILHDVAASDSRFSSVKPYRIPSGATDALPFQANGFDAVALGCMDPTFGSPRYYHRPTDTLENLDLAQLATSVDFTEELVTAIIKARLG
jgi:Zn-dependent M28 family amino/carboxypeptidase